MQGLAEDRYACVFWHVSGLHWYDMSNGPAPAYSGDNYPLRIGAANGLVAYQGKTLATLRGDYVLLDRHERHRLAELPVRHVGSRRHRNKNRSGWLCDMELSRRTGSMTYQQIVAMADKANFRHALWQMGEVIADLFEQVMERQPLLQNLPINDDPSSSDITKRWKRDKE